MNWFSNVSVGKKLILLVSVFITGYLGFALFSFRALNTLRIQGKLYNQIIMSKDLIADILPPPEYIIESYLNVLELYTQSMADETDPGEIRNFTAELRRLKQAYDERHRFWISEPLFESEEMRNAMLEGSYDPAIKFYDITFNEFIPALEEGDQGKAKQLVLGDLKTQYQRHRKSIDRVVELATRSYEETEVLANRTVQSATLEKIKALVHTIQEEALRLSGIGNDLAAHMGDTGAEIEEITGHIEVIKNRVINQSASVTQTNATMEQITVNIEKLNDSIEKQSSSVAQSSSAIEEMLANIRSVTDTLMKNTTNVTVLTEASNVGRTGIEDAAAAIAGIAKESEGLLEINGVMQNIAAQTNLLAMNAAIEAAHAGDTGRGFAVVADEIRKLAENSSLQSKTIAMVLKKIHDSIGGITDSTANVLDKFGAIGSGVKTVSDQEESIRNAMEEQGQGSKQILEAIGRLNDLSRMVKDGAQEMRNGSDEVIRESRNLDAATAEITAGMNDISSGAEHINSAVEAVRNITERNRESIGVLVAAVSKFKV